MKCAGCKKCIDSEAKTGEQCVEMRDCPCHSSPSEKTHKDGCPIMSNMGNGHTFMPNCEQYSLNPNLMKPSSENTEWEKTLDSLLEGIDLCETDSQKGIGWWETSVGAKFGANKKEEIKDFIRREKEASYREGQEKCMKLFDSVYEDTIAADRFLDFSNREWEKVKEFLPIFRYQIRRP